MVNNAKKKLGQLESGDDTVENAGSDCGSNGGGGGGGVGNVHGTDEKSQSLNTHPRPSNNIPPAISQIDVEGTLHANEDKELDVSLDAANCDDDFCGCEGGPLAEYRMGQRSPPSSSDGMTMTRGMDNVLDIDRSLSV